MKPGPTSMAFQVSLESSLTHYLLSLKQATCHALATAALPAAALNVFLYVLKSPIR